MTTPTVALAPFLALHALHTVPPSLLNRDDNGAAKKITLGGTARVRVSSQAWKRAIRVGMRDAAIEGGAFGLRTTRYPHLTAAVLTATHGFAPERADAVSGAVFAALGMKINENTGNTAASVFASEQLPAQVAAAIAAHDDQIVTADRTDTQSGSGARTGRGKNRTVNNITIPAPVLEATRAALDVDATIDLALFGRMLAEIPGAHVDGAVAVAQAFSVDPLAVEPDFFTAVDDAAAEGEAVANMLDTTDLTAPTLYRYAVLDRRQLRANLAAAGTPENVERLAAAAEASFITQFLFSLPRSKFHSTAANTLPLLVIADAVRSSFSLADAYARALTGDDVAGEATDLLLAHHRSASRFTGSAASVVLPFNPTITAGRDFAGLYVAADDTDLIAQVQR